MADCNNQVAALAMLIVVGIKARSDQGWCCDFLSSITISSFVFINAAQPALLQRVLSPVNDSSTASGRRSRAEGELGDASGNILVSAELTSLFVGMYVPPKMSVFCAFLDLQRSADIS